jgi:hypothetical protein
MMCALPALWLLACSRQPVDDGRPTPEDPPGSSAVTVDRDPPKAYDNSPTPLVVPTADTAPLPPAIIDAPDLRIEQNGNADWIGLWGHVRIFDFVGDDGLNEIITGGSRSQTFVFQQPGPGTTPGDALILSGGGLDVWAADVDGDGRTDLIQHDGGFDSILTVHLAPYDAQRQFTVFNETSLSPSICVKDIDRDGVIDLVPHGGRYLDVHHGPFTLGEVRSAPAQSQLELHGERVTAVQYIDCSEDVTGDGVPDLLTVNGPLNLFDLPPLPRDATTIETVGQPFPYDAFWQLPQFLDHPDSPSGRAMVFGAMQDAPTGVPGPPSKDRFRVLALPVDLDNPVELALVERVRTDIYFSTGDLDGDGFDDLVVTGTSIRIFYGPLVGHRTEDDYDVRITIDRSAIFLDVGDVNGDGIDDLVTTGLGDTAHSGVVDIYYGPLPQRGE